MQYKDFAPTGFDPKGLGLHDRQGWIVGPVTRTRDSDTLTNSNWDVVVGEFLALDPDEQDHETHAFNHWGPGWFEIVLVRPGSACADLADEWERALLEYPVADEEHWSRAQWDAACEAWERMRLQDRIEACARHDVSIFAARREEIPTDPRGEMLHYLTDAV